jgi:SsrA-binding protein
MAKKNQAPATKGKEKARRNIAGNRRARFEFELLERWEAGIALTGSEVKSCRAGAVNLAEAFVRLRNGEAFLVGCRIAPYENAGYAQHDPLRERKLLLHRDELRKIRKGIEQKGLTLVPTEIYFSGSKVKVAIALARGKKLHDKRDTVKKREQDRSARQARDH